MKKNEKDKNRKIFISSRRGVIVVALIAVMVLMISLITASYSWFTPQEDKKGSMAYAFDGNVRSENCSMSTFKGTKKAATEYENGQIKYYKNQIVYNSSASTGSVSIAAGATQYFKTEIINADTNYASDISLFIKELPAGNMTLAVTYPGNSVRTVSNSSKTYDYYIVRDAYVKKYVSTDVNGPGKLEVEWFITNNGSGSISVNLNYLYLLYN